VTGGEGSALLQLEEAFGLELTADQKHRVRVYIEQLRRWNRHINLTSIDRVEEHLRLNFFEAFWAVREFLGERVGLADVGTGAGFPGLAMKIFRPGLAVTLIEPNYKKAVFLKETARTLALTVEVFVGKGEEFSGWDQVELAVFRALRPPAALLRVLRSRGIPLLLFEGQEGLADAGFRLSREARVPLSEHRYVRLLESVPASSDECGQKQG